MESRSSKAFGPSPLVSGLVVTAISAGLDHTCVVADGAPYCWGNNYHGQLGDGSWQDSAVPVAVDRSEVLAGTTVSAIAAGDAYTRSWPSAHQATETRVPKRTQ